MNTIQRLIPTPISPWANALVAMSSAPSYQAKIAPMHPCRCGTIIGVGGGAELIIAPALTAPADP